MDGSEWICRIQKVMSKVLDINKERVQCELCSSFFLPSEIFGHDEDGNAVCNTCMETLSKVDNIDNDSE